MGTLLCAVNGALLLWRHRIAVWWVAADQQMRGPLEARMRQGASLDSFTRRWVMGSRLNTNEQDLEKRITLVALLGLVVGAFFLTVLVLAFAISHNPRQATLAEASFAEAALQPAPSGRRIDEVATSFLISVRARSGRTVRSVAIVADRVLPPCDESRPGCAPDNPDRPVRQWDSQLVWEERDAAGGNWEQRSCPAVAVLTAGNGWRLEGTRSCD